MLEPDDAVETSSSSPDAVVPATTVPSELVGPGVGAAVGTDVGTRLGAAVVGAGVGSSPQQRQSTVWPSPGSAFV